MYTVKIFLVIRNWLLAAKVSHGHLCEYGRKIHRNYDNNSEHYNVLFSCERAF